GTEPGVSAVGIDDAAVDHGGIELRRVEERADHRGRRRLAVSPRDFDRPLEPHELAQHFRAPYHGNEARARRHHLGIIGLHCRGDHHHLGVGQVLGLVADLHENAELLQPVYIGAVNEIATLHGIAEIVQDLGDAAHADAANADEVDLADVERQRLHAAASATASPAVA